MSMPEPLASAVIAAPANPRRLFGGVDKAEILYLRFDDEAAMQAAFAAAGIVPPDGQTLPPDFRWPGIGDVSVLGTIYNSDGVFDPETGELITQPTAKAGWHVNVLPEGA